jgi:hypothetical protein
MSDCLALYSSVVSVISSSLMPSTFIMHGLDLIEVCES